LSRGNGYTLFLTGPQAVLTLARPGDEHVQDWSRYPSPAPTPMPPWSASQQLDYRTNYFSARNPSPT